MNYDFNVLFSHVTIIKITYLLTVLHSALEATDRKIGAKRGNSGEGGKLPAHTCLLKCSDNPLSSKFMFEAGSIHIQNDPVTKKKRFCIGIGL